ncbi:Aldo/keto reductase [Porphyromonadaceae bacterium KH3CP3RA]|jgi:alcohol dehydrogenase (NADP+)|nr:Aldo/keto reductase [Porphyromonadaceae bacterium KH3CP3RA]
MDPLDHKKVPYKILYNGTRIPVIGMGTFGSDNYDAETIAGAVKKGIRMGYRHIDCASVYGNEKEIGKAIKEVLDEGIVKREDLWITSKVWNDKHDAVVEACRQTLEDLQLRYLDLYLVHWPFPNYHPPKCDVTSRQDNAVPYIHENYMKTWAQMESLVESGLVRSIGTSNMTIPKMKLLLRDCKIKPVLNEMEIHPHFQQPELYNFLKENGIEVIGFSPIGSPKRPERDRTPDDTVDIEDPVIVSIARRLNVHPAVVCLVWAVQRGQITIPFSVNEDKLYSNLKGVIECTLTDQEMEKISQIDKGIRLIKGQVFLWKTAKSWRDLWDIDGNIAQ